MKGTVLLLILSCVVCFGEEVRVYQVSDQFVERALTYVAPRLEPNVVYKDFFKNLGKLVQNLINDVVMELFRQIRFQSSMMANSAISVVDELQYELEETNPSSSNSYVDVIVKKLNSRLASYLKLDPGYAVPRELLEGIPDPQRVWSFITYHPLSQLFAHLETTLDLHLSNINALMDSFYKRGWEGARYSLTELQDQFREVYLNGYLLYTYNKVVMDIYQKSAKVQRHVKPETWKEFQSYASNIKRLYNQIKPNNETFTGNNLKKIIF